MSQRSPGMLTAVLGVFAHSVAQAKPVTWPLEYEGKRTDDLLDDERAEKLLETRVPDEIWGRLQLALVVPGVLTVVDKRYISLSGCVLHDCTEKGFFWLDTRTGQGLGAFFNNDDDLKIGSNSFSLQKLPAPAKAALLAWLHEESLSPFGSSSSIAMVQARELSNRSFPPARITVLGQNRKPPGRAN